MIEWKDWRLTWDGAPAAMQFDNGSVWLDVIGDMPEGYDWELLLQEPEGGLDILPMQARPGGAGVLLQRENLPKGGTYTLQVRGTLRADGVTQRHSSVTEVLVPGGGITMASCEQYHITVHGKGGHGSMPNACIDPITAAAHIHIALQEINSRELDPAKFGVFTTGRFEAGKASNVIPDTADMWGTIRTVDPEGAVSEQIHQRMTEIAQGVAAAYRCTAEVEFSDHCPCMVVDTPLAKDSLTYMTELLGRGAMDMTALTGGKPGGGSEDFAFVSHEVPTVSMFLSSGNAKEGYVYGQHHPKVRFDDSVLYKGSAAYVYMALRWLSDHKA